MSSILSFVVLYSQCAELAILLFDLMQIDFKAISMDQSTPIRVVNLA